MKEIIKRTKYKIYALDMETHNDPESVEKLETSMWLGSLVNEDSKEKDESSYFYTVEQLLEKLEVLTTKTRKHNKTASCPNVCIYIHELSFEWSFILPVILSHGYEYKEKISKTDSKVFNSISNAAVSSVWGVTLKIKENGGTVIFRDLEKMLGQPLPVIASSFDINIDCGEMDYTKNRLHNYKVTKEDKHYNFSNAMIVMKVLEKFKDDKDFFQTYSSSSYSCRKMFCDIYKKELKPLRAFRQDYPELGEKETAFLREGVAGGLVCAPDRFLFKEVGKTIHIDAHQMYPSQAYKRMFPCGYGTYFKGKPANCFSTMSCVRIKISYVRAKLHSIVALIGIDFIEDFELTVWDFEIPTMYKCYEGLTVEYIDGYSYPIRRLKWKNFYKKNYDKRLISRQRKDAFGVFHYKLLNNGGIGKFLEKPHTKSNINTISMDGIITSDVVEKDEVYLNGRYTYVPVGSAISAYAKVELIETALKFGYEKIVYMDTDSLFILDDEGSRKVLKTLPLKDYLNNWGIEDYLARMETTGSKRYKTENYDGGVQVKISGINGINTRVSFDNVNIMDSSWNINRVYRCKGGTIMGLENRTLGVKPTKQYLLERTK